MLQDVYDGEIWKQYMDPTRTLTSTTLALMLNIDWLQPFKDKAYSVGVVNIVIMNLPRHLCFQQENVIFVGIIPGTPEPSHDINSFLAPLLEE